MSSIGAEVNQILREIKLKRKDSFERLFAMTYNHLKIVAFNYLADKNDVEDVLNEAYLRVYRFIDTVDLKKDGYNWICKIIQNVAYDFNAKKKKEFTCHIEVGDLFYELDENKSEYSYLWSAILELEPQQRKLIYYRFWEGYSLSELAKRFELKKTTVHKKLQKIFLQLKKKIGERL